MSVWFARRGNQLIATDELSLRAITRLEQGECQMFKPIRVRSGKWHRLYFGLCRVIGQNQDPPRDPESIDAELRIRAGHFDVLNVDGHEVRVPKRIAFSELSADEWEALWPSLDQAMREHFGICSEDVQFAA